ncbi:MAG: hypothetical protein ABFD24_11045 [Anaerolineaceae bacterium]
MEIETTPKILMQSLLEITKKGVISLINLDIDKYPPTIFDQLRTTFPRSIAADAGHMQLSEDVDLYKLLKLISINWHFMEQSFVTACDENNNGKAHRSFLELLRCGRNEDAHDKIFSYEDVLLYGFVIRRFFSEREHYFNQSMCDEIIEESFRKLSETMLPTTVEQKKEIIPEVATVINTPNEETKPQQALVVSDGSNQDLIIQEGLFESKTQEEITDIFMDLVSDFQKHDYDKLITLIDYPKDILVEPGIYKDTLHFSAGSISFAMGSKKLNLIKDYLLYLTVFALTGIRIDSTVGEYEGYEVICLPSNEDPKLLIGRTRARILCSSMDEIDEWLKEGH